MGTDVHAVWQTKTENGWKDIPSKWDQGRHYFLFSWLADVRNGYGFAGVPTYTPIKPISEPRGLPTDFIMMDEEHPTVLEAIVPHRRECMEKDEMTHPSIWMGDHDHSWLTVDEILSAERPAGICRTGIVTREYFDTWDGKTSPETWSGGISGPAIRVAETPTSVTDETTHVRIYWKSDDGSLDYFIDEAKRLKEEFGEVRLVFGFDS